MPLYKNTKSNIPKILETMDHGKVHTLDFKEAIEWAKSIQLFTYRDSKDLKPNGKAIQVKNAVTGEDFVKVYEPEVATVELVLKQRLKGPIISDSNPMLISRSLYELGSLIERNENIICQLETLTRGISVKDTKNKSLPLLVDYFHYYSRFSAKCDEEDPKWDPHGVSVGIFAEDMPLFLIGCFLGPALAAGYHVIIQTAPKLNLITRFVIKLTQDVGFPAGCIRLIGGNPDVSTYFRSDEVAIISIFDNIFQTRYAAVDNGLDKKVLYLSPHSCPYVVFEDADLDSACENVIPATWGYQGGSTPWSVRNVYVQEKIFKTFVYKLKNRILKTKCGSANDENADVTYPYLINDVVHTIENLVKMARSRGIEVFQGQPGEKNFKLTLFIGGKIGNNNVLKEDPTDVPVLTITAFRSINEGVDLANNSRQGLAASIWTNNLSLANEVASKLKVCNVWINCHGLFSADRSFASASKGSSNGYFGGKEGFYEYVGFRICSGERPLCDFKSGESMEAIIKIAKRAQNSWSKLSRLQREKQIFKLPRKYGFSSSERDEIHALVPTNKFNCTKFREPLGVIMFQTAEDLDDQLVTSALLEGNSVIVLNISMHANGQYKALSDLLPRGVLTCLVRSLESIKTAAFNVNVDGFFSRKFPPCKDRLPLIESGKFKVVTEKDVVFKVTTIKNVWSNVGQSFL